MDSWKEKIKKLSTEILDCRDCGVKVKGYPIVPCFSNEIDSPDILIIGIEPKQVSERNRKHKDYILKDVEEHLNGREKIRNVDHLTKEIWKIMSCADKDKGRPKEQLGSFYRKLCNGLSLRLSNVVITDAIKCPKGKDKNCEKWLKKEMSILEPKKIITVGKRPKKMVNRILPIGMGIKLISVPHPSFWKYNDYVSKAVIRYAKSNRDFSID